MTMAYRIRNTPLLETGLLEDAVAGAGRQVIARLARDGDTPSLARVFELPMTAALRHLLPSIGLKQAKHLADLHGRSIAARSSGNGAWEGSAGVVLAPTRSTLSSPHEARVTELVDVGGLKPPAARRMGSIPIPRTNEGVNYGWTGRFLLGDHVLGHGH
jgi:hypothetical protein